MSKPANKVPTERKHTIPKSAWKKGQSGNPKGRPPDGESWAGVLRWAAELTGTEAAAVSPPEMAREFKKLGNLKLKQAVTLRTFAAMLFDPSAGLFNAMMDRAEGKVADKLEIADWRDALTRTGADAEATFRELVDKLEPKLLQSPAMLDTPQPAALQPAEFTDATDPSKQSQVQYLYIH